MKVYDYSYDGIRYTFANEAPNSFTTTGSTLLIEWYSGPDLTSIDLLAKITARNITMFENTTIGDDGYCSAQKPCLANEGDCDFSRDCAKDLWCINDGCSSTLELPDGTDCCQDGCYGLVDMELRVLKSPFYPFGYGNNLHCTNQISVEAGKIITLEFQYFHVSNFTSLENYKLTMKVVNTSFRLIISLII